MFDVLASTHMRGRGRHDRVDVLVRVGDCCGELR